MPGFLKFIQSIIFVEKYVPKKNDRIDKFTKNELIALFHTLKNELLGRESCICQIRVYTQIEHVVNH